MILSKFFFKDAFTGGFIWSGLRQLCQIRSSFPLPELLAATALLLKPTTRLAQRIIKLRLT